MAADPHTAVKQELLVRYLDFWVPAALHSARSAGFLDSSGYGAAAALPVVAEFADLLAGRELWMLVAGAVPADPGVEGLRLTPAGPAELVEAARGSGRAAVFGCVDGTLPAGLAGALAQAHDGELLLGTGPVTGDPRVELVAAGFGYVVAVELVDGSGAGQLLRFATSAIRSVERFKDELWAVDRYAGIRYRDPVEPQAAPLEISFEPDPGPLRRALLGRLESDGPRTLQQLREFALTRTLYRPADVPRALSSLLARGQLAREPQRGRLTGDTVLSAR